MNTTTVTNILRLAALGLALSFLSPRAYAAEKAGPIVHAPLRAKDLPAPGSPLTLSFRMSDPGRALFRARALAILDGKLIDVPLIEGPIDDGDKVGYRVSLSAPAVEIKYQFLLTAADGEVITSPQFGARRACVPDLSLVKLQKPDSSDARLRIETLVLQARGLEDDIREYENTAALLEQVLEKIKE